MSDPPNTIAPPPAMPAARSIEPLKVRRLPKPQYPPFSLISPEQIPRPVATNPYALQIAETIQRACAISKLNPFTVFKDFVDMLEGALRLYGPNLKALSATGYPAPDPPDVAEVYHRARNRYIRQTLHYPAAYREMETAFVETYNLLMEATAQWDLSWFIENPVTSPDILGEALVACIDLNRVWWSFFPPWQLVLEIARQAVPDPFGLAVTEMAWANIRAKAALGDHYIAFIPGETWEAWFAQIHPYYNPIPFQAPLISSNTMMLAVASLFPDWVRSGALVTFTLPEQLDPLLRQMGRVSIYAYGPGHVLQSAGRSPTPLLIQNGA